jgi:hypothetical protein
VFSLFAYGLAVLSKKSIFDSKQHNQMKTALLIFSPLLIFSCRDQPDEPYLITGTVVDTKWFLSENDTVLLVHSVFSTEYTKLSSNTREFSDSYSSEDSRLTVFKLQNKDLKYDYQTQAPCIDSTKCGTRFNDKIVAFSSDLFFYECMCEEQFTIVDIRTGKEWANALTLKKKFPEYTGDVVGYYTFPSRPECVEFEFSDGQTAIISLETKSEVEADISFDRGTEVNTGLQIIYLKNQALYFEKDGSNNRSYLVVNPSGHAKGSSEKYKTGSEFWIKPVFLSRINSVEGYVDEDAFYILHAQKYSESDERDLLSKVNMYGEILFTIDLKTMEKIDVYFPLHDVLYFNTQSGLHIFDAHTGKNIDFIEYNQIAH